MLRKTPLVSIIMGAHNEERFVGQAVDSILNQSFRDFEFIITNDGSLDKTGQILSAIPDPRIVLIHRHSRQGLTAALNAMLARARGKFIARMDADDLSHPTRLEEEVTFLERFPEMGLVGSWYQAIDEDGQVLWRHPLPTQPQLNDNPWRTNPFCHGSVMFRREIIDVVGYYRIEFKHSQDHDFWLRIREHFLMDNIPKFLYNWRFRLINITYSKRWLQKRYSALVKKCYMHRLSGLPEPLDEVAALEKASITKKEKMLSLISDILFLFAVRVRIDPEIIKYKVRRLLPAIIVRP